MSENIIYYQEIFASIQGESTDAGLPCVFVRFYGCPIGCNYCDQPQTPKDNRRISIANMVDEVLRFRIPYVCITGGEPLVQRKVLYPLIYELQQNGCRVSIETSGCFEIEDEPYNRSYKYIMDIKCPSSGVSHKNKYENLMRLKPKDEVKFVISDEKDYSFMKWVLKNYPTLAKVLVSPCFDEFGRPKIGEELVQWLIRDRLNDVRVQIQMHKVIGVR